MTRVEAARHHAGRRACRLRAGSSLYDVSEAVGLVVTKGGYEEHRRGIGPSFARRDRRGTERRYLRDRLLQTRARDPKGERARRYVDTS